MIVWDPTLATGDGTIDGQHQHLFSLIGELHQACLDDSAHDCLGSILSRLAAYTEEHFAAEQELMSSSGYTPVAHFDHVREHVRLTASVRDLIGQHQRGEMTTVLPVAEFLHEWLRTHIRQSDRAFVAFLQTS